MRTAVIIIIVIAKLILGITFLHLTHTLSSYSQTKPLESLFVEYSKFRNMERSKLKFLFDGDSLEGNETPEELDMEDENVIDVRVL